jgi:hypothetical protein
MVCEIKAYLRESFGSELIFFQTQVLKRLVPFMEEMLVEFNNGSVFICLPEIRMGEINVSYNLTKDIVIINERDPVLRVIFTKKKRLTKVYAIVLLSRIIAGSNMKIEQSDVEAINLIRSGKKHGQETEDQLRKAICMTFPNDTEEEEEDKCESEPCVIPADSV